MNQRQIVLWLVAAVLTLGWAHGIGAQHQPVGELIYAMHVTIPPAWFDPAENSGLITPFAVLDIRAPSTGMLPLMVKGCSAAQVT
jgi:hypothetical protein